MSPITTHILDTALGQPARGVAVTLERASGDTWAEVGHGVTDDDGRVTDLMAKGDLSNGRYRIRFATGDYHQNRGFYPEVSVVFEVRDATQHYHVPLLLNPFGFSTYRGS